PYALRDTVPIYAINLAAVEAVFFKVDRLSLTASHGQDIMGYTKDQVSSDILDADDAHMMYMSMIGDKGSPSGMVAVDIPEEWTDSDHIDPQTATINILPAEEPTADNPSTPNEQGD